MPKIVGIIIVLLLAASGLHACKRVVRDLTKRPDNQNAATRRAGAIVHDPGCGADSKLNSAKNRTDKPGRVQRKTLAQIVAFNKETPTKWRSNADRKPLTNIIEGRALQVMLYLKKVTHYPSGAESCNCNLDGEDNNDFHIVLVSNPDDEENKSLTAEISPRIRPNGWSFSKLKRLADERAYVRVTGWAMLDTQHVGTSIPARKTHWELHPVTKFEVCTTEPGQCKTGRGWKKLESLP